MGVKPRGSKPGVPVTAAVSPNTLNKGLRVYCETWQQSQRKEVSRFIDSKNARIPLVSGISDLSHSDASVSQDGLSQDTKTFLSGSTVQFRQQLTTLDRALSVSFKSAEVCDGFQVIPTLKHFQGWQ